VFAKRIVHCEWPHVTSKRNASRYYPFVGAPILFVCRFGFTRLPFFENQHRKGALTDTPLIAIVDDDETVGEATREFIETVGLAARTFVSAEVFLDSDCVSQTSCLVVDVQMPGLNGLQLQRKLANSGHDIPVIFITAFPDERLRTRALKAGAICYLKKPFDPTLLLACIRSAIGAWASKRDV
jgi:FixJ family two-component response regulator